MTLTRKIIFWIVAVFLWLLIPYKIAYGMELETNYTIIHYDSQQDLEKFSKAIRYDPDKPIWCIFDDTPPEVRVKKAVDAIHERISQILKIQNTKKTHITLYPDIRSYKSAVRRLPVGDFLSTHRALSNKDIGVMVNLDDIDEKMLAHEMTHDFTWKKYGKKMPREKHEKLAQFVERNLYFDRK